MKSSLAWRTPFIILTCLSMAFVAASSFWLVASPRWLILRGRQAEVSAAWDVLGLGHAEREKAEIELRATLPESHLAMHHVASSDQHILSSIQTPALTTKQSFLDVFAPEVRSRTGLAVFLLGMQQFSGIDGVLYVSQLDFAYNLH